MEIELTKEQAEFLLAMLDKVPVGGLEGMGIAITIAHKLQSANQPVNGQAQPPIEVQHG